MIITCRNVIALLRIYWTSNNSYKDWVRLIFILILVCLNVYLATLFNEWKNAFYTALENYDYEKLIAEIICFCKLAAIAVLASMYSFYLQQIVLLNWRRFLSEYFIDDILCKKRYYMFTIYENVLDNPDQRLTEDIKIFAEKSIEFTVGIINALITLTAFVGILWSLSGALPITIGNYSFTIHGYIVWGAFAYFSLGTYITYVIGKKLKLFNYLYQSSEANFRYALIRLYEYAEQIALLQKENKERGILVLRLNKLLRSFYDIIIKERRLAAFKTGYFQLASIIPVLFCVPLYLKHTIKLGGLMQSASAFSIVIGSLSYFIRFYAEFAEWLSCVKRLHDFQEHFLQLESIKNKLREKLLVNSENIELIDFALYTPKGQKLLSCNEFTFFRKENCLIMGMNGSGKSTFFKTIAGIWPYFTGKILLPKNCNIAFLPQKPYLPLGVLGNCIIYSNAEEDYRLFHNEIVKWLEFFNMRYLIDKLDKEADWCKILSLGEQQKLAIIRALILQPEWLFMDESTSNMDDLSVRKTYEVLSSLGISVVSISHDAKIRQYHSRVLRISANHIYE